MKHVRFILIMIIAGAALPAAHATVVDDLLKQYSASGASNFSASRGETQWSQSHTDAKSGKPRSCKTCHGNNLRNKGKHIRTGKIIEPMAPSVNSERLTELKKINKWFKRNCKWVLGRECTSQEKGDYLMFIRNQ